MIVPATFHFASHWTNRIKPPKNWETTGDQRNKPVEADNEPPDDPVGRAWGELAYYISLL
jgi:hypothetical protein